MVWNRHRVIVLAPGVDGGEALVIAAGRCGALGVWDATGDDRERARALARFDRFGVRSFGARLTARRVGAAWLDSAGENLSLVVLAGAWTDDELADAVARFRAQGRRIVREVISMAEADAAIVAGVDGLIAVGNEAGGRVGSDSSFIMLQALLARLELPIWVRGGVGPRVASGCVAAGAAGVVLDGAVLLARESPLADRLRDVLKTWDGGETQLIEPAGGDSIRVFAPPSSPVLNRLREAAEAGGPAWLQAVARDVGWADGQAWPIGQDAAFANDLSARFATLGGMVQAVESAIDLGIASAALAKPLAEGAPLAQFQGTRFPILQGPMTRVSDVAPFAAAVAGEGALPFVALALLKKPAVERLLAETRELLKDQSWGVGLLGFAPPELRQNQLEAVLAAKPPFALIAGGRPDQAAELEGEEIPTYLHVPSPGLIDRFLRDGARRFVLEGRECGGHVGPRSSFALWELGCREVAKALDGGVPADEVTLIFAGGIHDARSAATVAALAGDLAARGVKIGVLMGTAYLFTREAVETGAIVARYQDEVSRCRETVLLETGPGHLVRVGRTPFVDRFHAERAKLLAEGAKRDELRDALERLNLGRLRLAAKGVARRRKGDASPTAAADSEQAEGGLYMLGQAALLRQEVVTMRSLHEEISQGSTDQINRRAPRPETASPTAQKPDPAAVAIVGLSAILPGAEDAATFWDNSLAGRDSIVEIPGDRWDWRLYYDPDPKTPDKIYSKWGGFVPDIPFDPLQYGMPPSSLPQIEPAQLLALEVARKALADAGYADREFPRERTAVVLGMGGGAAQTAMGYAFRSYLPMLDGPNPGAGAEALELCDGLLPEWTEDSFPGFLLNVTAGRIANRLDLGGANYTVDAACGSSLAALNVAVRELRSGAADMVILGGVDTVQNPFTYLAFSKTQAFSPRGRCRPFDQGADGIVISEGAAAVVLKRLADAERDGDRIYAVIQGVGSSSDGRSKGLTAPNPEGQTRALKRAYAEAGVDPASVGYVEAHGTGTAVGDVVEVAALGRLFREAGAEPASCAVGSVKSQIGHTKCAAGLAGLIHAALALHHRILPPTIGVESPNPKIDLNDGPLRLNVKPQPWLHPSPDQPRRAGVSAFGFGGTNFHVVMEAYERSLTPKTQAGPREWPAELLVWTASNRTELLADLDRLADRLDAGARPLLRDLAHALNARAKLGGQNPTLAIVASDLDDLVAKLASARASIQKGESQINDPRGVQYHERPPHAGAPIAFVFPGQGAQAVGMLGDLAVAFEEVRDALDEFDAALVSQGADPVGPKIFPPPAFSDSAKRAQAEALKATETAQPALGAASFALSRLLREFGLKANFNAGHSYGELVALHEAGAIDAKGLAALSSTRGRLLRDAASDDPGVMAALATDAETARALIGDLPDIDAVNLNGPRQTVVAGSLESVQTVLDRAEAQQIRGRVLPVARAFHTARMEPAREPLALEAAKRLTSAPAVPVFSNLDAQPHPGDPRAIADRLGDHVVQPVRFAEMIEAMRDRGARVFVEVGPGSTLGNLISSILDDSTCLSVSCDAAAGRSSLINLLQALAKLAAAGASMKLDRLTRGRSDRTIDPLNLPEGDGSPPLGPSTWLVNGSRARPINGPEPKRLGQANISANPSLSARKPIVPSLGSESTMSQPTPPIPGANDRPPARPAAASSVGTGGAPERVMAAFQETMRTFLEVQQSTMLAYLSGKPAAGRRPPSLSASPAPSRATPIAPAASPPPPPPKPEPEPAPQPPSEPKPEPAAAVEPVGDGRESIAEKLLEIVCERTGYPREALQLGLDIEADLGIDSIKRVEILGKLRDAFPQLSASTDSEALDGLTRASTLGAIVDRVERMLAKNESPEPPHPTNGGAEPRSNGEINGRGVGVGAPREAPRRLLLEPVDAPFQTTAESPAPGETIVITDDGRGVAEALSDRVRAEGLRPIILGGADAPVDWTSPAAVEAAIAELRQANSIAGIVHATPLRLAQDPGLEPSRWADRAAAEVRGLFLLAKAAERDLEKASKRGAAALISATAMGGALASAGTAPNEFFNGHGAIAGLLKTLAREWPGVRVRAVDFDPKVDENEAADRLFDELLHDDAWSEVGHRQGRRVRLKPVASPLGKGGGTFSIQEHEPILISGGARGITALVAAEMARRWRPTLLLLGTSPPDDENESPELASITRSADLKAALYKSLRRSGRDAAPASLERAYRGLQRAREVRANLARFESLGARVEYARVDVRDAETLEKTLAGWRKRFGDPVGLIHGAGLIQDKLIGDKSPESFDRVMATKLDGALNLVRFLRPDPIRFAVFFSSIAGRFGNRGQSDYAAANDALNKLAVQLDNRWPGRIVAPIWGPWSGVGMVSDLEAVLGSRGLGMIDPEAGVAALFDELERGRKGDVEVILANDLGGLDGPLNAHRTAAREGALR